VKVSVGRVVTRLAGIVGVVVAVGVIPAAPALADPAGLVLTGANSVENSSDKLVTALCPTGKVVSGGGGYLVANPAARGRVALDRLEPLASGAGFTAVMREAGPTDYLGDWALTAKAHCVTQPAGYQVVAVTGPAEEQYVTASCGTKRVIGMGGRVNGGGGGDVVLDQVVPSFDLKSVTVRGFPVPNSQTNGWTVTSFAVCATAPPVLTRLTLATVSSSDADQSVSTSCPAGQALYSLGADIQAANGEVLLTGVNNGPADVVRVWANEYAGGWSGNWTIRAYGICG